MNNLNDQIIFLQKTIEIFNDVIEKNQKLNHEQHGNLILELQYLFGCTKVDSGLVIKTKSGLRPNIRGLNAKGILPNLVHTLYTVLQATEYKKEINSITHQRNDNSFVDIKVNNREIYNYLQGKLDYTNFSKLFQLAEQKGVFDLSFEGGVPSVTLEAGAKHMTRKWPRDHAGMMSVINARYPQEAWLGLEKVAETYLSSQQLKAFEKVMLNPELFKDNQGIAHVFWLDHKTGKLRPDNSWHMNQRIESHGEFLNILANKIITSNYDENLISDNIIQLTIYLMHYLYLLGIRPQTCGPWEEIPFAKGSNWDCASIYNAFNKIQIMIDGFPKKLHSRFIAIEKKLLKKIGKPSLIEDSKALNHFNQKCLQVIQKHYIDEFRGHTNRIDSSSAMLAAAELNLSPKNDFIEDIQRHIEILERFEKNLVGEYGARRYNHFNIKLNGKTVESCDSYLNKNCDILLDNCENKILLSKHKLIAYLEYDGNDASEADGFAKRACGYTESTSAQWGLPLSYAAIAYGHQVQKLLKQHQKNGKLSPFEQQLLTRCLNSEVEYIKRSYANITGYKKDGTVPTKANGKLALAWKKPEAYQCISTADSINVAFLPGVNSHLGWDASKCWEASKLFLNNLAYLEKNQLL